ncbi:MAG: type II CAAX endopeptidase family protein [Caulobacter sp.]|nr:type II CAAX endopeptidase family protein [Caulobacter sp.]
MTTKTIFSPQPHKGWLPWGLLAPFLCIFFVALCALGPEPLLERQGWVDARGEPLGLNGWYAFLVIPFALNGLLILAWTLWVERRPQATIGLTGPAPVKTLLGGVLVGAATILAVVVAIGLAGGYSLGAVAPALASPAALTGIGLLLLSFVVQAGVEEIIFRGWLLSAITRKLGLPVAVVLVSLTFTFLHYSPHQHWLLMLSSFLFSAFACAWAIRAGSIWGVMGWHAGWNWLLATGFELPVTGLMVDLPALLVKLTPQGTDALTGGAQGPEGSWLCSAFFAVGILVLWLRRRKAAA